MNLVEMQAKVEAMMPELLEDLRRLVAHKSVSFPGFPGEPVHAARAETIDVLRHAGFSDARELDLSAGYPAVQAELSGANSGKTALLYAHYDVQPAPLEQGWQTDPWTLLKKNDGRYYGRGAADDKSGIVIHAGTLRVFDGKPPVNLKLIVEGEEETNSNLEPFIQNNPEFFQADAMLVSDMGNIKAGEPSLTTTLRGTVVCVVETKTIDNPLHSGIFGGPTPDALVALIKILGTLWDDQGNTAVKGLRSFDWPEAVYPEDDFRKQAGILPEVALIGNGSLATRLWSKPSVTVIGLDAPGTSQAGNALIPSAKARLSLRIAPGENPKRAIEALKNHLLASVPWGVQVSIKDVMAADAFTVPEGGAGMLAARQALAEVYGQEPSDVGSGGTIPLLQRLREAAPRAEFVLWGAADAAALIHGPNESVDPDEIAKMILAQALFLQLLADTV
jgi:acetylornithine deacetylase/succinyl-diaminopimelate desuccinylase-like protein